jgi:hypothetical protein
MIEYDEDIASFYVEVDYIIVARNHVMSQQLFSSNCRQLLTPLWQPVVYIQLIALIYLI